MVGAPIEWQSPASSCYVQSGRISAPTPINTRRSCDNCSRVISPLGNNHRPMTRTKRRTWWRARSHCSGSSLCSCKVEGLCLPT
uniref:Uncharacterized protein n=1 Tax=Ciona intestinalis TaxID=7719 RepID=H2XS96_CIOIN